MFQKYGEANIKLDIDKLWENARRADEAGRSTHETRAGGTCVSLAAKTLLFSISMERQWALDFYRPYLAVIIGDLCIKPWRKSMVPCDEKQKWAHSESDS